MRQMMVCSTLGPGPCNRICNSCLPDRSRLPAARDRATATSGAPISNSQRPRDFWRCSKLVIKIDLWVKSLSQSLDTADQARARTVNPVRFDPDHALVFHRLKLGPTVEERLGIGLPGMQGDNNHL